MQFAVLICARFLQSATANALESGNPSGDAFGWLIPTGEKEAKCTYYPVVNYIIRKEIRNQFFFTPQTFEMPKNYEMVIHDLPLEQ